jgi:cellulose synthase/poly-beta-1,6-N-acetylglucosamine synthase-like glycosyltransferase
MAGVSMGGSGALAMFASFLLVPLLVALIDGVALFRARANDVPEPDFPPNSDFTALVPIYGSIRYLENVEYLSRYGGKIMLCTTGGESDEFYRDLGAIADRHGFDVFRCDDVVPEHGGKRNTGGTIRDRLIREALYRVQTEYVVCIDADTETGRPLEDFVGAVAGNDYDVASIRLVVANPTGLFGRLQAHEYRVAMAMRRVAPWMVSGACHAGRTSAWREVMSRHSLFFQGNDIEMGILAGALGFKVGHIPYAVPTTVPATARGWLRQRLAWAGGEFRLFIVNIVIARRHPWLWFYGAVIMFGGLIFRWYSAITAPQMLIVVYAIYLVLVTWVNWQHRDWWLVLTPLYATVTSLFLTALAPIMYARMALASRNAGVIRPGRKVPARE